MVNYFGATIPLGNGLFGRSQGLLDTAPQGVDPGFYDPMNDAFMRSYAVQPSLYTQYAPAQPAAPQQAPAPPAAEPEVPFQFKPEPQGGEGGYDADRGSMQTAQMNPDGFLTNTQLGVMSGLGLLTRVPFGTMGQVNNYMAAEKLADKLGYTFDAGPLGLLGQVVNPFGLFGDSIRDRAMSQLGVEAFNTAPNQRALDEYAASEASKAAQRAAAAQQEAVAAAQAEAQRRMNAALDSYYSGGSDFGGGGFDSNTSDGRNSGFDSTGFDSSNDTGFGPSF